MADQPTSPAGPDLSQGVPVDTLADGSMVGGHVGDDAVLLARVGDELFAVGATCTHYGGPLAEGLMVGDTVRCPWHHTCFSLRTGDALRAPALRPLPRWAVAREGERIVVREKIEPKDPDLGTISAAPRGRTSQQPASVLIIGAGAAGSAAAEMLRREGYAGPVTMAEAEPDEPCDRPNLSKDYLAGNAPEEWLTLRPPDFYRDHDIALLRETATRIDPAAKRVSFGSGATFEYGALLLATGAEPVRLPDKVVQGRRVYYLRTVADSRAIVAAAKEGKCAVVIGASFIGLEVAASLRARGLDVHVVAPEARPLERVLGPQFGDFIRGVHEEHGVRFHLGQTVTAMTPDDVTLATGERIACDLVVAGVGVRPRTTLAEQAGLRIDRGVAVNERLATSVAGIFAAGDIARYPDPRLGVSIRVEHWAHAQWQGQAAARNILGAAERFNSVPFFWSNHYDVAIAYVGHAEQWDGIELSGALDARDCAAAFRADGKVIAVASVGRDRVSLQAELAMEGGREPALAEPASR